MSVVQPFANLTVVPSLTDQMSQFVQMVRLWLRDYAELNRLLEGEEHSDRLIVWATLDAMEDFNETPPPLSFSFSAIPKSILRYGVALNLYESLMFLSVRNSLAYSDGGINVNLDKSGQIMQIRSMMEATYERKKREWKISKNIAAGYGGIQSEYWYLSGFYGAW